jgi:hypothetical protein
MRMQPRLLKPKKSSLLCPGTGTEVPGWSQPLTSASAPEDVISSRLISMRVTKPWAMDSGGEKRESVNKIRGRKSLWKTFQLELVVFQSQQRVDLCRPQRRNKIGDQSYCNEKK